MLQTIHVNDNDPSTHTLHIALVFGRTLECLYQNRETLSYEGTKKWGQQIEFSVESNKFNKSKHRGG